MNKGVDQLAGQLLSQIFTSKTLKLVSDTLEELTQNKSFKEHGSNIATDPDLTKNQKKTQLTYLVRSIELPIVHQFLSDQFESDQFWLFSGGRIDYLDRFVQAFQNQTETVQIVYLETAVSLNLAQLKKMSHSLTDLLGSQVIIHPEVNSLLTGGFKIKIENMIYDYSLHTKYMQFQQSWMNTLKKTDKVIGRNVPESTSAAV